MKAMMLTRLCTIEADTNPLTLADVPMPKPQRGEVLIKVHACGVCHTELDEIEGRTAPASLPVIPGHEIIGSVVDRGEGALLHASGARVGVGWIHSSSGACDENLASDFLATGRDVNGGYAQFMTAPERYAYPIPDVYSDTEAAPLLCAGAVGYRALRLCRLHDGEPLGLTGFGGSAHIVAQLVRHLYPSSALYVFARDAQSRRFAMDLGAVWAGDIGDRSPQKLKAIIDTTPVWRPIVEALADLAPGGRLVVNAIRKRDADKDQLMRIDYAQHLWREKELKSVANVCGTDIAQFLPLAAEAGIRPHVKVYSLTEANAALRELKQGGVTGAIVLDPTVIEA